ncbi:MAG: hypothetical protein OEZ14_12630 [Acidimicrobiia bacterium]|nr:hypothetical protein [Acidimicrobiia bacterium]
MRSKATPPLQALSPKLVPTLLAVLLTFGLATSCGGDAESSTDEAAGDVATGVTLELDLGESNAMASCLPVDAATLSQMAPAFQGTVTAVEGETITLDVDTWYAGVEEADTVQLHAEQGLEALIGGIDFQVGEPYLITAANGTINYCGYSGPADPTLTALFDEAFAG